MTSALAVVTVGGNELGLYDYLAFLAIAVAVAGTLSFAVFMLGLPGRLAIARKHPEAEAVNVMGWAGFLAVVPWMQAFIWAFKPTDVVDVRRFPRQEQEAEREELARLAGKPQAPPSASPPPAVPPAPLPAPAPAPPTAEAGKPGKA
jgi:hypothetical protein